MPPIEEFLPMIKLNLQDLLKRYFLPGTIELGREYFVTNRVTDVSTSEYSALGRVQGSKDYFISLHWQNTPVNEISAHCTCPHFESGNFCKHLWAFIIDLDFRKDFKLILDQRIILSFGPRLQIVPSPKIPAANIVKNNWRDAFKVKVPSRRRAQSGSSSVDLFMVLNEDHYEEGFIRLQFFGANQEHDGSISIRPFLLPIDGNVKSYQPKMQEALRAVAMISLGEMNSQRRYNSYSMYRDQSSRSISVDSLKLILRDLLETSSVYYRKEDYLKSKTSNIDSSLKYTKFENIYISVDSHSDGHIINGRLESVSQQTVDSVKKHIDFKDLTQLSKNLFLIGNEIGFLDLNDIEKSWFDEISKGSVLVPTGDEEPFLEAILNQSLSFELPPSLSWPPESIKPIAKVDLTLDKKDTFGRYIVDIKFEYGSRTVSYSYPQYKIPSEEDKKIYTRNQDEEARSISLLPHGLLSYRQSDNLFTLRAVSLVEFAKSVISQGISVTVENKKLESEATFNFSVSSGVDWFDVGGEVEFSGKWIKIPAILEAISKGEKFVPLSSGGVGIITDEMSKKLERLSAFAQKNSDGLRFTSAQGLLLNSILEDEPNVNLDAQFKELKNKIKRFSGIEAVDPVKTFNGNLRKYQREGLGWLEFLEEFGLGGILADDMGLGKTIQCLAFLEKRRLKTKNKMPSLLVAPKSLLGNWKNEAATFTPKLDVLIYAGNDRHTLDAAQFESFDLVVTTYQTMLRDFEFLKDLSWDCLICDEAQAIKNPEALISKAIKTIPAKFRLAMTGTPIENSIQDLFSISDFVNPGFLNGKKQSAGIKISDEARDVLSKAFKPVILRRTKDQVLKDLPEKIEQVISVELDPKQQKIYNDLKRFYQSRLLKEVEENGINKSQIQILAALTRLRQVALHPGLVSSDHTKVKSSKFEVVLEMLEEIISEDHRVLVFSQFTSLLALLKKELKTRKIDFCYLDGKTTKRQETVDEFKKSDVPVFLMSLKAGGTGLNLVEADYVFLLDPWWNPAVEAQAIDRIHRIGQKKAVNAYRFIAKNTVEEKIMELQNSKRNLTEDIIGKKSSPLKSLTAQDIQNIFT